MEWSDIRIFLQVARSGQMAVASRLLNIDHSTISRRIARLEETTGVALFDRAGRRLRLTAEGAKLLSAAEGMEAIVIRDVLSLRESRENISGKVRIGTSEGFGSHYLATRLPAILSDHPGLELELVALHRRYSLGMREVDIVISMDRPEGGDVRFKKLCETSLGIYVTRDYFTGRPIPSRVDDLKDDLWCGYIEELLFTEVLDMMTFGNTTIVPRYRTTSVTAQLGAALSGAALAVLPTFMAQAHPTLVAVPLEGVSIQLTYWMSVHSDLARSPRVRAVMDAIDRIVQADRDLLKWGIHGAHGG